jgi:hypothetical protein
MEMTEGSQAGYASARSTSFPGAGEEDDGALPGFSHVVDGVANGLAEFGEAEGHGDDIDFPLLAGVSYGL